MRRAGGASTQWIGFIAISSIGWGAAAWGPYGYRGAGQAYNWGILIATVSGLAIGVDTAMNTIVEAVARGDEALGDAGAMASASAEGVLEESALSAALRASSSPTAAAWWSSGPRRRRTGD